MALPRPSISESKDDWFARCMRDSRMKSEFPEESVRTAVAVGLWEEHDRSTANERLRSAIADRKDKKTEFGYGILTADSYVKSMQEVVGLETCYNTFSTRSVSFHDVIEKASKTLVYSNPDMVLLDKGAQLMLGDTELPKNTLMVFKHRLTSPRKDRDGDILRTEGAVVDEKMPLLWQHCHSCPIGKMIKKFDQNENELINISAIVDINELAHDAAVMIDNGIGRFSHGFRAMEYEPIKEGDWIVGFDIKKFEIMEESLVSVPSNVDAEVIDVLVTLVSNGKLTSGIMKEYGSAIRQKLPLVVQSGIDLKKADDHDKGTTSEDTKPETDGAKDATDSASEKTNADAKSETSSTDESQVTKDQTAPAIIKDDAEAKKETTLSASDAAAIFLAKANVAERKHLSEVLAAMSAIDSSSKLADEFRLVVGR